MSTGPVRTQGPFKPVSYGGVDSPVSNLGRQATTLTVAGAKTILANAQRSGLTLTSDPAGVGVVYGLCGPGVASATNFHFAFGPGLSWNGQASQVLWTGAVSLFCAGSILVGVLEV